ncbi:hypothetical protein LZK73_18595 [Neorhizobium galegae]|nr:hypothetical protein LZK73_18595 [Neorhizobium galegae]
MADKFKIRDMKLDRGQWRVTFDSPDNWAAFGSAIITFSAEVDVPQAAPREMTADEAIRESHMRLAQELRKLFIAAVMSTPDLDDEKVKAKLLSDLTASLRDEPAGQ